MKRLNLLKENLHNRILKYGNKLWSPTKITTTPIETHSWFDMYIGTNNNKVPKSNYNFETDEIEEVHYKCRKKVLRLNEFQKTVILSWMDSYIEMYNETLKVIKSKLYTTHQQRIDENKEFQKLKEENNIKYKQELDKYETTEKDYKQQLEKYEKIKKRIATHTKRKWKNIKNRSKQIKILKNPIKNMPKNLSRK